MAAGSIQESITSKLQSILKPSHLEVINESHAHNVPKGSETHFKVIVVSEEFDGLPLIKRHRKVNEILADELQTRVHALSIQAKTPEQWSKNSAIPTSPPCMGGSKR